MPNRVVDPKLEERLLSSLKKGKPRVVAKQIETHLQKGGSFQNKELLAAILEPSGMTVAHQLAFNGIEIEDPDILSLKGEDRSEKNAALGHNGCTVAYILAKKGYEFRDPKILMLGNEEGKSTVAHAMAQQGHAFEDQEILKLRDDQGITVAHIMAKNGHVFTDNSILDLKSSHGFSVKDFQNW